MLNMIKMDLYRMFRTKSLYIIWIIMAMVLLFSTYMSKTEHDQMTKDISKYEEEMAEASSNTNVGMRIILPTKPGERVTVFDLFFANTQSKFITLFLVIFAVIFAASDINSGYIKNIGGQVKNRGKLICSKAASLGVFTVLSMALAVVTQAVSNRIFFGYLRWGDKKEFLLYLGIQIVLHFALVLICMTIAVILRNNAISMVVAICLCMNLMMILYGVIDNGVKKMGIKDFQLVEHTVTGKISLLSMASGNKECISALGVAAVFIVIATLAGGLVFEKRDI